MIILEMEDYNMILTENANLSIIIWKNWYTWTSNRWEILPSDQRRVIEQAYFPLGKPLRKQAKTIKDQEKKQLKATEEHWKHLTESNELIKNDFHVGKNSITFKEQKRHFMNIFIKSFWIRKFRR